MTCWYIVLIGYLFANVSFAENASITYGKLSLEGLRQEMVHVAAQIQEIEAKALDIETTLSDLVRSVHEKEAHVQAEQATMTQVMHSLTHLVQVSPLLMTLTHQDPNDVVRAGVLMKSIVPGLSYKGNVLVQQLVELRKLKEHIEQQKASLEQIRLQMASKQEGLAQLYAYRGKAMAQQPKVEVSSQALSSSTMPELLDAMSKHKSITKALERSNNAGLVLNPPVPGRILTAFDQDKTYNSYGKGVVIQTRLGAQVVSPVSGAVVFAGPFRGYGKILILGSGREYHVILAGLESIDVAVGQDILLGEPVGRMSSASKEARLYLELRKEAETIDPTPWVIKWKQ